MSRSNNTELINPAKYFFEWVGSEGKIKYFDKNKGEKGERVFLDLPFTFLVLDKLSTIKGFSDADQSGFWSNEVRNTKIEPFTVRTKKGIVATGLYETLAGVLNAGAAYCQSVYIAYYDGGELVIANFQIHGSAIGAWIEFCKKNKVYDKAVTITGATAMKKGKTDYFVPVYAAKEISEETNLKAIELDRELQEYLSAYFKKDKEVLPEDTLRNGQRQAIDELKEDTFHSNFNPEPVDDLPF